MDIARTINFLKRYLPRHPLYVVTYVFTYFLNDFSFSEYLYSRKEIADMVGKGRSIIRFGDGEINPMLDLRNHYEQFSPRLKAMMKEIASSYSKTSPYVLSLPRFIKVSNYDLKKIGKFNVWLPLKVVFLLMFPKRVGYMDAHNFYYEGYFDTVIAPIIKDKQIVYITRKKTIDAQKENTNIPWKNAVAIETPEHDALGVYEEIKASLDVELSRLEKKNVVLLVGMGPVGKYLIFEYAKKGIQGIDVGIAMETMFTGKSLEHLI